jgi:ComF family protein
MPKYPEDENIVKQFLTFSFYYHTMNFGFFGALFFGRACVSCKQYVRSGAICASCFSTISVHRTLSCGSCGARLFGDKILCHPGFPYLLGSAGNYEVAALRMLVHALKFRGIRSASEPLAALLIEHARSLGTLLNGSIVLPIPLSSRRERARGFNQSQLIAYRFAEELGLAFEARLLRRTRHTKPQSETRSVAERSLNVRDCFAVTVSERVYGKNIVLIDDVTTSGKTFFEAASVLKAAGAEKIYALAAARA